MSCMDVVKLAVDGNVDAGGSGNVHFVLKGEQGLMVNAAAAGGVTNEKDDEEGDEGQPHKGGESDDYHGVGATVAGWRWTVFTGSECGTGRIGAAYHDLAMAVRILPYRREKRGFY